MKYVIEKIQIQNLKYVTDDKPILVDIEKSNMVVLNGQNGYGKTTFFDAIELLVVGGIEHLAQIVNRQSSVTIMGQLANSQDKDIVIIAWLVSSKGEKVIVQRKFKKNTSFESEILWNDEVITQDVLNSKLQITKNFFRMGTYMSQSKSLSFLENKSKDRKALVADLVSTKDVDDKVLLLKETTQALKEKIRTKQNELDTKVSQFTDKIKLLRDEINFSQEAYKETEDYARLFEEEYIFDKKEIEIKSSYSTFIEPLIQIRNFIVDFEEYSKVVRNNRIDYALNMPKHMYMKLYFSDLVKEIDNNENIVKNVEESHAYLADISKEKWYVNEQLCNVVGVSSEDINILKKQIENLNAFILNLGHTEQYLLNIQDLRKSLIEKYHSGIVLGHTERNKCPLCGSFHEDIDKVFEGMEKTLLKSIENSSLVRTQLVRQIKTDFEIKILPLINNYITKHNRLYTNSFVLKVCRGLNTDELEKILRDYKIETRDYIVNQVAEVSMFEKYYANTIQTLHNSKEIISKIIPEETIHIYKAIHSKYYKRERPKHSAGDIDGKIGYIAKKYVSDASNKISLLEEKKRGAERAAKQFEISSEKILKNLSELSKKYNDVHQKYQSKLATAIRVPVLIYSGKILQNFPLGLGIDTKVAKNQLTFESFEKRGTDVFNILSTGQLNGLAISILLAIRNVYGKKSALDVLMIDDPLQTIDEISAISFADLLCNSDIKQVIMSTHEDRKARMLEYKFRQRNLKIKEINMKQMYLSTKD